MLPFTLGVASSVKSLRHILAYTLRTVVIESSNGVDEKRLNHWLLVIGRNDSAKARVKRAIHAFLPKLSSQLHLDICQTARWTVWVQNVGRC